MTDPIILPGLTTGGFTGQIAPPQVRDTIINLLISGAPFANSLTRDPTTRPAVSYPVASPTGFAWLSELEEFPLINLNDDAVIVAVKKIGGLLQLSNELVSDSSFNATAAIGQLLRDGLSREMDQGLLFGTGNNAEPNGVVNSAPSLAGPTSIGTLLGAVSSAIGEIVDAGGSPDTIALSGALLAFANSTTATDGQLIYPSGFPAAIGLSAVMVPGLSDVLVYDSSRIYLVVNGADSEIAVSADYRFAWDATTIRVKTRASVAVPNPAASIRKLEMANGSAEPAKATATTKAAPTKATGKAQS